MHSCVCVYAHGVSSHVSPCVTTTTVEILSLVTRKTSSHYPFKAHPSPTLTTCNSWQPPRCSLCLKLCYFMSVASVKSCSTSPLRLTFSIQHNFLASHQSNSQLLIPFFFQVVFHGLRNCLPIAHLGCSPLWIKLIQTLVYSFLHENEPPFPFDKCPQSAAAGSHANSLIHSEGDCPCRIRC